MVLVLLRVSIGWHFLYQGIGKLKDPAFASEGFLSQAKGPFAGYFHDLIPDYTGQDRLKQSYQLQRLQTYAAQFAQQYKLDNEQQQKADALLAERKAEVEQFLGDPATAQAIEKAATEWAYVDTLRAPPGKQVPYREKWLWDKQSELRKQAQGWLDELDKIHGRLEDGLASLLTSDQRGRGQVQQPVWQNFGMDQFITWTNIAIGLCLIVGLFTRLASLGGGAFLALIVLATLDWPWSYPPLPPAAGRSLIVNKEFIEMMALFFLATTQVGRWGGLDFFIHNLIVRPLFGRKES